MANRRDPIPGGITLLERSARLHELYGCRPEAADCRALATALAGWWAQVVSIEADHSRLVERLRELEERNRLREAELAEEKARLYLGAAFMLRKRAAAA